LGHIVEAMTLDAIVAFDNIVAFVINSEQEWYKLTVSLSSVYQLGNLLTSPRVTWGTPVEFQCTPNSTLFQSLRILVACFGIDPNRCQ
jgi:hypothetical protein